MDWRHVLIESYCLFDKEKNVDVPNCCIKGIGNPGIHCFSFDEDNNKYCPFLGFQNAKTSIALTSNDGDVVSFDSFQSDVENELSWFKRQKEWIKKYRMLIENNV